MTTQNNTSTDGAWVSELRSIYNQIVEIDIPEVVDSQSSSDLSMCECMRVVQADAFKIVNMEEK